MLRLYAQAPLTTEFGENINVGRNDIAAAQLVTVATRQHESNPHVGLRTIDNTFTARDLVRARISAWHEKKHGPSVRAANWEAVY